MGGFGPPGPEIELNKPVDTNNINLFWISLGTVLLWFLLLILMCVMLFFLIPIILNPARIQAKLAEKLEKLVEAKKAEALGKATGGLAGAAGLGAGLDPNALGAVPGLDPNALGAVPGLAGVQTALAGGPASALGAAGLAIPTGVPAIPAKLPAPTKLPTKLPDPNRI